MASHDGTKILAGKVALVTGAGRGLGRAFAEKLAALGTDVAIHDFADRFIMRHYGIVPFNAFFGH